MLRGTSYYALWLLLRLHVMRYICNIIPTNLSTRRRRLVLRKKKAQELPNVYTRRPLVQWKRLKYVNRIAHGVEHSKVYPHLWPLGCFLLVYVLVTCRGNGYTGSSGRCIPKSKWYSYWYYAQGMHYTIAPPISLAFVFKVKWRLHT